jgi:hypothetical protein
MLTSSTLTLVLLVLLLASWFLIFLGRVKSAGVYEGIDRFNRWRQKRKDDDLLKYMKQAKPQWKFFTLAEIADARKMNKREVYDCLGRLEERNRVKSEKMEVEGGHLWRVDELEW